MADNSKKDLMDSLGDFVPEGAKRFGRNVNALRDVAYHVAGKPVLDSFDSIARAIHHITQAPNEDELYGRTYNLLRKHGHDQEAAADFADKYAQQRIIHGMPLQLLGSMAADTIQRYVKPEDQQTGSANAVNDVLTGMSLPGIAAGAVNTLVSTPANAGEDEVARQMKMGLRQSPQGMAETPVAEDKSEGYDNGGAAIQKTFEAENAPSATVSPKPGQNYGQIAGKTINQQRIEDLSRNAMGILNGAPVRQWAEKHFGIKDYNITPVLGTWQNEPEPSFSITGKNLNKARAQKFASALGMGMWQDAAVHSYHHPQEDLDNGAPTVLLGHGGVLTPQERQKILSASAEHKRDLTFTRDGKAAKFSFFGDPEEHEQFVDDIDNIKKKSGMPEALMVRTAGDLTDAKDYFKKIVGSTRQRKGLEGSSGQPSDLFRGLVDHVLTPFTREAEKQGYRFSLERFANHHALTDAERQYLYDKATPHERKPPKGVGFGTPTVKDPVGYEYPGIYGNPKDLVAEAASRVAPESPNLKKLFNVTRADLYEMGKNRVGNMEPTLATSEVPRGSLATEGIMTPKNEQRLIDILTEAGKHQGLRHGMDAWYVMDPLYQHMVDKFGHEGAVKRYKVLNTLTGMASPGSEVPTEINRGMAAYYLHNQGRFEDFMKHAGKAENKRGADFPADIRDVMGHPYHSTSQAGPMQRYLQSGSIEMGTPKVPTYIPASGVPATGFQTTLPVPDAHFTRIIGMADTRKNMEPGASMKMPEYQQIAPWWKNKIASQVGLQSVPAQARIWGAGSGATGVSSPIGAPKLEMFADYIAHRAQRHGVKPEVALDRILGGQMYNQGGRVAGNDDHYASEHFANGGEVESPKKTVKAYKLFRTDPRKPGQIFPLFVDANTPVPMNKWVKASAGPAGKDPKKVKSKLGDLAYRPGWHAGDLPVATHIGEKSDPRLKAPDIRPANHSWAEIEMPNDVDWQSIANKRMEYSKAGKPKLATAHITDQVPHGGHYRYKTNPNMTGNWLIGGEMKVNRILNDDEVKEINDAHGVSDLPRAKERAWGGRVGYADGGVPDINDPNSPEEKLKKLVAGTTMGLDGSSNVITPGYTKSDTTPDTANQNTGSGIFGGIFGGGAGATPTAPAAPVDPGLNDLNPYNNANYQPGAVQSIALAAPAPPAPAPVTPSPAPAPAPTQTAVATTPTANLNVATATPNQMFSDSGKFTGRIGDPLPGALLPAIAERQAANLATYGNLSDTFAANQAATPTAAEVGQNLPGAVTGQNLVGTFDPLASQDVLGDVTHGVFGLTGPMGLSNAIQETQDQIPDSDNEPENEQGETPEGAPEGGPEDGPEGGPDGGPDGGPEGERRGGFIRPRHHAPLFAHGGYVYDDLIRHALRVAHQFGPDAAQRAVQIALQQAGRR